MFKNPPPPTIKEVIDINGIAVHSRFTMMTMVYDMLHRIRIAACVTRLVTNNHLLLCSFDTNIHCFLCNHLAIPTSPLYHEYCTVILCYHRMLIAHARARSRVCNVLPHLCFPRTEQQICLERVWARQGISNK